MTKKAQAITLPARFEPMLWESADGRSAIVREIRRRVEELQSDCNADSAPKRHLCERAAFITVQLETQERKAVDEGSIDLGGYVQGCNGLLGILKALGLERRAKQIVNLQSHLARKRNGHANGD